MQQEELPATFFAEFDKDFRAEVTAAEIVELGTSPDRILILLLGAMKRSHQRDIVSIAEELFEHDNKEYIVVKTPREGFYDMLPEGLFHNPSAHRSAKTEKEIIKAIKKRKEEEQDARKFFLPFEATINYLRMEMALNENKLDKRIHYDNLLHIFTDNWEIFDYLDARQSDIFLHLIPILHDLRDNHPVIETILEMLFQLPVQLTLRSQLPIHPATPIVSTLGDNSLGVNLTTGNELFDEGVDEIVIKFGPISNEEFQQFSPGLTKHKILELLIDYLLPVHLDIITEFELYEKDKLARLTKGVTYLNSVLGADTFL